MVARDVFKVLKLHSPAVRAILRTWKNITRAHVSRNALAFIRFPIHIGVWKDFTDILFKQDNRFQFWVQNWMPLMVAIMVTFFWDKRYLFRYCGNSHSVSTNHEKCCGNTSRRQVFPQLFRVLPNCHGCFYNSIKKTCFLFLLENTATITSTGTLVLCLHRVIETQFLTNQRA